MIKRLLSKALLSVFLEKDARDKVLGPNAVQPGEDDPLPERLIQPSHAPEPDVPLKQLSKQASDALARAQADLNAPPPKKLQRVADRMEQTKAAGAAIPITPDDTPPAPAGSDRQALIAQALAVQQKQAKKLDDLPPEDKLKLHLLARMALLGEDISNK